ncbi:DUF3861 domain-containing protein [Ferrimonas pelagia]|uniref:DUF3861 domain-containing protein n=1 Tax=Ferrimonas pelagia TaxID=1177826 RepID=A0ABP9EM84_9GAMM
MTEATQKPQTSRGFRVIIEPINASDEPMQQRLEFEVQDRENVFATVAAIKQGSGLDPLASTQLGVGLRILGPLLMQHRKHPLFAELMPHFKGFMLNLKRTLKSA